jgi:hypothetical protein
VGSSHQRLGVARLLTLSAIAHARHSFRSVRLRTDSSVAAAFYGALGFSPVHGIAQVAHECVPVS